MPSTIRSVCVFCGSSPGALPAYADAARALGFEVASRGLRLVYGGGNVGLMGVLAEAAHSGGAEVIGVIPEKLHAMVGQPELAELLVTADMHGRKAKMAELADAFIALPGGIGTFEELFEAWTWRQIGYHSKPIGILEVAGFYAPLLGFLDHATREGFIRDSHLAELVVETDPARLLDALARVPPPTSYKV
ncbi:MAG: TIGR00730 family Rossman fold protein, partial [Spirochaetota bacterium]